MSLYLELEDQGKQPSLKIMMKYEKENSGKIVWVLGPSIALDDKSRAAFLM